ncbi:MAG: DUF6600 domain-containing protein [Chthoniobacteraceae bacterium]|jgi:hypothetical protein
MKLLPAFALLTCVGLLASCGRNQQAAQDQETQERIVEEQQAAAESGLHERQAALDEQQAEANENTQALTIAASPAPATPPAAPPSAAATPAENAPPSPDVSEQAFFDYLSPFGTWLEMPGYGFVWRPQATLQDVNWRPYTLGRFIFTDAGWTWDSDEPFGWITYHYGRWMRTHTLGWVWVPGDQWAPAWVAWRYGNDFVGWAPLPPEAQFDAASGIQQWTDAQYSLGASDYTFVPASEFGDDSMASVEVPPDDEGPVYDESTNVTDIYYDAGYGGIICYGPNYDFMRTKARRALERLSLQRDGFAEHGRNGAVVSGKKFEVTAPRIVGSPEPAAPRNFGGQVADSRLVTPPGPPRPPGAPIEPLYHPQPVTNNAVPARVVSEPQPGPRAVDEPGQNGGPPISWQGQTVQPVRQPVNNEPQSARNQQASQEQEAAQAQQAAREEQAAQQQQAADQERQRQQADQAREQREIEEKQAEEQRAEDAARASAEQAAEADRAARDQERAQEEAARQQQQQQSWSSGNNQNLQQVTPGAQGRN